MTNKELAKIFSEMALFLEMDRVLFKPQAYKKASQSLNSLNEDVRTIYQREGLKGLEALPGVGKGIAQKIEEYITKKRVSEWEEMKKRYPIEISDLAEIEGLGPHMIKELYERLGIKNVDELERAAREGKIRNLPNFGPKTEKNILESIRFLKENQSRFLLAEILPLVEMIVGYLKKQKGVLKVEVCGSIRRKKETIGDVDILSVTENPRLLMDAFCSMKGVIKVWAKGLTKSSVRMKEGFDVDLRVVKPESFAAALQYFTGSREHNIALRKIVMEKNLKLNEYGLFKKSQPLKIVEEEDIYRILGMDCPPPEIRENRGEIAAALEHRLPFLVELSDIKGDLHTHSSWDGGQHSIKEMALQAQSMGYQYIGVSDHTKFLKIEHGLGEHQLIQQHKEIKKLNETFSSQGFQIFHGAELNILKDGSLDIRDEVLKILDYAIAGVHSNFKMSQEQMTERIIRAMRNPYVKIISHPTGRILRKRDAYALDIEKIMRAARETKTALEVNAFPERLDLNDVNVKMALSYNVKIVINSDAHQKDHLKFMKYGVYQARRGWAQKNDVLNTLSGERLIKYFKL